MSKNEMMNVKIAPDSKLDRSDTQDFSYLWPV
jgi:hypothetical protein